MKQQGYLLWLANGTVLLVAEDVPAAQQQAALDTLIYAQLVADKAHGSRFTHFSHWHGAYVQAISNSGWIITQRSNEQTSGDYDTSLTPAQVLRSWLEHRHPSAGPAFASAMATIATGSVERLRSRTQLAHAQGSYGVFEVAVLQPGQIIDLCSVFVDSSATVEQVGLGRMIAGDTLRESCVKGFRATLDEVAFERHRAELHALVERKQEQFSYLIPLGTLNGGGEHA